MSVIDAPPVGATPSASVFDDVAPASPTIAVPPPPPEDLPEDKPRRIRSFTGRDWLELLLSIVRYVKLFS